MRVAIFKYNSNGASASLEADDEMDSVQLAVDRTRCNAKSICKKAAERLRAAADKFDLLAKQPDPFKSVTQDAVNSGKIKEAPNA